MFTLSYPLELPNGHAFHLDERFEVPPIDGSIEFVSISKHHSAFPQLLTVRGFPDLESARDFAANLGIVLKCATLSLNHGIKVSQQPVSVCELPVYDGNTPTIFQTSIAARPVQAGALEALSSNHVSVLIEAIDREVRERHFQRARECAELNLAIELFSEVEFAGGTTARFVMLFSALEVLVERNGKTKRGQVQRLVKNAIASVGRTDGKAVSKRLDSLYQVRNNLLHEGKPIDHGQLSDLLVIVRDTLRALLSADQAATGGSL